MNFKPAFLAFSVFSLSGFAAGADEALNVCNIEIEGATVVMSRDEIAAEWSSRGYVESPLPPSSKSRVAAPDPDEFLSFQTADGLPNNRFITAMHWAPPRYTGASDSRPYYNLSTTYRPPADAAGLEVYKQFLRDEITSWCQWATSVPHRYRPKRGQLACGQVLAGKFSTTLRRGIPSSRIPTSVIQTWNGCNWKIRSDPRRGHLTVTISGPVDLAK